MNSLRTLQALNQVVNHDICPQMKALIAENKRLVAKNNRCLKKIKDAKSSALFIYEMNKELRADNTELMDWKDYMLHMDYFRCIDCKSIHQEESDDDTDADGEHIRCEDCSALREEDEAMENTANLVGYDISPTAMLAVFHGNDVDMETDPRFEYDEEQGGYIYTGNV